MTYLLSMQWRDMFDVIVVEARKPSFYYDTHSHRLVWHASVLYFNASPMCRPFRCLNSVSMTPTWTKVTELIPGMVYQQGNVKDLIEMMNWQTKGVLYFGDHVFSDLAVSDGYIMPLCSSSTIRTLLVGPHSPAGLENWCHYPRVREGNRLCQF